MSPRAVFDCMVFLQAVTNERGPAFACLRLVEEGRLSLVISPQVLSFQALTYEMNDEPLKELYGAPLRLRVENQLGFKMVKWIQTIEFVESHKTFGEGEGGYNEDHEYFGDLANI